MIERITEGTTAYLQITFLDKIGREDLPLSATYRIDCLTTGAVVREETSIVLREVTEVHIAIEDTQIVDPRNPYENKLITFEAAYGEGDKLNAEYAYSVQNLHGVGIVA